MAYSRKRQRFLVNQGYAYKVVNEFPDMAKEHLDLGPKDEQLKLLSQVLQASDIETLEEDTKDELNDGIQNRVLKRN